VRWYLQAMTRRLSGRCSPPGFRGIGGLLAVSPDIPELASGHCLNPQRGLGQAHETIAGARYDHQASARRRDRDEHVPMRKRVLAAVLWGLAVWTWVSMAHAFLGIPELGMIAGLVTAAVIVGRGFAPRSPLSAARSGDIASRHSNRSGSHA
jgi:hypothetical protein